MRSPFQSSNLAQPSSGSQNIDLTLDFTAASIVVADLSQEVLDDKLPFVQSIYIDNADNPSRFDITFAGAPVSQRVSCPAFAQGWFPITMPVGAIRISAACASAVVVNCILANYAMPYLTWGDSQSVNLPLVNQANNAVVVGIGDTVLVAAVAAQAVKLYRGQFETDTDSVIKFTDGAGGAVLWTADLQAFGSLNFPETLIPWLRTTKGNALVINSSAALALYGGFSYVQS